MTLKGGKRPPNDWKRRLRFVPPSRFFWAEDPPAGAAVGDRADFVVGNRRFIRTVSGRNINLDDVGAEFEGYRTPPDHAPRRARAEPQVIRSKWGPDCRRLAAEHNISLGTLYARLRLGMSMDDALTFTQQQLLAWKRDMGLGRVTSKQSVDDLYTRSLRWVAGSGLDGYQPPSTQAAFRILLKRGYTPQQAVIYHEGKREKSLRNNSQSDILRALGELRDAMPEIQNLFSGSDSPGVLVAARLLGIINMMGGAESDTNYIPESVYGNAVLAALSVKEPQ